MSERNNLCCLIFALFDSLGDVSLSDNTDLLNNALPPSYLQSKTNPVHAVEHLPILLFNHQYKIIYNK